MSSIRPNTILIPVRSMVSSFPSAYSPVPGLFSTSSQDVMSPQFNFMRFVGRDGNNQSLRALSQGWYVSINFTRSINEATFISYILQRIRVSKLDLDQIADSFCTSCLTRLIQSPSRKVS